MTRYSSARRAYAVLLSESWGSTEAAARMAGVSRATVCKWRKDLGLPTFNKWPNRLQLECRNCGEHFERCPSQEGPFCSHKCVGEWRTRSAQEIARCGSCGRIFSRIKSRMGEFCSKECHGIGSRSLPDVECSTCGTSFRPASSNSKYCSNACSSAPRRRPVEKLCLQCGSSFTAKPSTAGRKYCNEDCMRAGMASKKLALAKQRNSYIVLRVGAEYPGAHSSGTILEHRYVVQEVGCTNRGPGPLAEHENVHHINGLRWDNRPENLEVWISSQPSGQRVQDQVAWAKWLLATYEPDALASGQQLRLAA